MVNEASGINKDLMAAGRANFVLANAVDMPFAAESFDKVFTINTIYFWDEPAKILSEIKRILSSNGILAIGLRTEESMKVLPFVQYGFTGYDKTKIRKLLEENGFEIIDIIVENDKKIERENDTVQMENMIAVCTPK
jgi:ubiquinone/menaquinone biosynthesis C-methylase UbiE